MSDEIGSAVRSRRELLGYSQADLVDLLAKLDISLSRSHLANMESGRYPFQRDQLLALDAVLALPLAGIDRMWQSMPSVHLGAATDVVESLIAEPAHSYELDLAFPGELPLVGSVVSGVDAIDAAIQRLFHYAASRGTGGRIVIAGVPSAAAQPHIPRAVRALLVRCLKQGYECTHLLSDRGGEDPSGLMKLAGSLLACQNYNGLVERGLGRGMEFVAVVARNGEWAGAIQLLRRKSGSAVHQAVAITDRAQVGALIEFGSDVAAVADPLVSHLSFTQGVSQELAITESELALSRVIADYSDRGDWAIWSEGWLPQSFIPPEIFERRMKRRLAEIEAVQMDLTADRHSIELIDLQRRTHNNLLAMYDRGVPMQVLLSRSRLTAFVNEQSPYSADGAAVPNWRRFLRAEAAQMLNDLITFAGRRDSPLELRLIDDDDLERVLRKSKFHARGGRGGYVVLQTPIRDGGTQVDGSANIVLEDRLAAIGFKSTFDRVWCRAESQTETLDQLDRAARML